MKILFTKTGIEHEVSEKLETGFLVILRIL